MTSRHLIALALLTTACASPEDVAVETEHSLVPDDDNVATPSLQAVEPRDPSDEPDEHDCALEDDDLPSIDAVFEGPAEQTLGRTDALEVSLRNVREQKASVRVHAFVFSAQGSRTVRDIANIDLSAGDKGRVELPIADLGLTTEDLERSGRIALTVEADYADGGTQQPADTPTLYFHPLGDGTWAIYDSDVRDSRYDGGALTDDALRFARKAEAAGSVVLDAHVHPRVPDDASDNDGFSESQPSAFEVDPGPQLAARPDSSEGGTVDFCFRLESQYDDAGMGEDFWTSNSPTFRDARGLYVRVERYTSSGWSSIYLGYTGDGIGAGDPGKGCTGSLASGGNAFYRYTIWARSRVQGNTVEAWDDAGPGTWVLRSYAIGGLDYLGNGQHQVDISTEVDERLNVLMMTSYGIWRHAGGMSGQLYKVRVDDSTRYDSSAEIIYISDASSDEKFKGLHEVGHAIGDYATNGMIVGSNYSIADSTCPSTADSPTSTNNHSLLSLEFSEAAANEGFAHFYAADVYNDDDETDCWFGYYKNEFGLSKPIPVNCEVSNTVSGNTFSTRFMETRCGGGSNGRGVELDWLRAFWDVHTNGSTPPHFNTVLDWIDTAGEPSTTTAYDELDDAADDIGGSLRTNWNNAVNYNGIDW